MFYAFAMQLDAAPDEYKRSGIRHCPESVMREVAYSQRLGDRELIVVAQVGADGSAIDAARNTTPAARLAFSAVPPELRADDIYVSALPLLPNKREDFLRLSEELRGPRSAELLQQMQLALHGEIVFLQPGAIDYVIPIVIGSRPWEIEHRMATGDGPFNKWLNAELAQMHGIDFSAPPPPANILLWDVCASQKER